MLITMATQLVSVVCKMVVVMVSGNAVRTHAEDHLKLPRSFPSEESPFLLPRPVDEWPVAERLQLRFWLPP